MRFLWNLLSIFLLLALLAFSIVGVMTYAPSFGGRFTRINAMGENLIAAWRPANGLFWIWLAMLLGSLAAFLSLFASLRPKRKIQVQMGGGRVVILDSAIRKYLKTALAEIPDITTRKIYLKEGRHGLDADVRIHVRTNQKLPDIERRVIDRVRTALADELGVAIVGSVHVSVLDVELATKPEPVRRRREETEEKSEQQQSTAMVISSPQRSPAEDRQMIIMHQEPQQPADPVYQPFRARSDFNEAENPDPSVEAASRVEPSGFGESIKTDKPDLMAEYNPKTNQEVVHPKESDPVVTLESFQPETKIAPTASADVVTEAPIFTDASAETTSSARDSEEPKRRKRGLFGLFGREPEMEPQVPGSLDDQVIAQGSSFGMMAVPDSETVNPEDEEPKSSNENVDQEKKDQY